MILTGHNNLYIPRTQSLGNLGASKAAVIGNTGKIVALVGGPIGAGIGIITGIISGIFAAHAAKVAREDEISNAWASTGPLAIEAVLTHYRANAITKEEALLGLRQIEGGFKEMCAPIVKTAGKFGLWPDPEKPRPANNCNWACGTYWDLHQQLKKLAADISSGTIQGGNVPAAGASTGALLGGGSNSILILAAIAVGLFFLFK